MHMYTKSEELEKELESQIQKETNESFKTQYQTILQTQRNITANLKSLGQANTNQENATTQGTQQAQRTQANNAGMAGDQKMSTAQHTSDSQMNAKEEAQRNVQQDIQAKNKKNNQ
jgi:hypothetical protein